MSSVMNEFLLTCMAKRGSEAAKLELFKRNTRLISKHSYNFLRKFGADVWDKDDLEQQCWIALEQALEAFDPEKVNQVGTFKFTFIYSFFVRTEMSKARAESFKQVKRAPLDPLEIEHRKLDSLVDFVRAPSSYHDAEDVLDYAVSLLYEKFKIKNKTSFRTRNRIEQIIKKYTHLTGREIGELFGVSATMALHYRNEAKRYIEMALDNFIPIGE